MEIRPLPALAAAVLPGDRETASRILAATLPGAWPQSDLLDVLPLQAAASPETECFGVWVMIERDSRSVVGDIGFMGPPDEAGAIEVGYSVIPERRRRGYATEAARAIVDWALSQPSVQAVVADCDSDNAASVRTLKRLGFQRTGEANSQIRWRYDTVIGCTSGCIAEHADTPGLSPVAGGTWSAAARLGRCGSPRLTDCGADDPEAIAERGPGRDARVSVREGDDPTA